MAISGSSIKSKSSLTPDQEMIVADLSTRFKKMLQGGVAPYKGKLQAPYSDPYAQQQRGTLQDFFSGTPSYDFSQQAISDRFDKGVVAPAMQAYDRYIKPRTQEAFARGGTAYNSLKSQALTDQLSQMQVGFGQQLSDMTYQSQGMAFQAAEAAKQRQNLALQFGVGLAQNQYQRNQSGVNAQYNEFLRQQPQNNPAIQYALALAGQSQQVMYQQPGLLNQLAGATSNTMGIVGGTSALSRWGFGSGSMFGSPAPTT